MAIGRLGKSVTEEKVPDATSGASPSTTEDARQKYASRVGNTPSPPTFPAIDLMKIICPGCAGEITGDDLNIVTDIARCRGCEHVFRISESVESGILSNLSRPPKGCRYEKSIDGIVISASTRSPAAFFLVPFMCVWSGFSLGGIYGTQIASGKFNLVMSLFGIPFILGSALFWSLALMAIWGRCEVRISRDEVVFFTGIGGIGRRKRLRRSTVRAISEKPPYGKQQAAIHIDGESRVTFGTGLNDERRHFLISAMRQSLRK